MHWQRIPGPRGPFGIGIKNRPKPAGMHFIHHYSLFGGTTSSRHLEKDTVGCHMTGADERPGLGFAGCVHEAH
jgi:hypothetical protein